MTLGAPSPGKHPVSNSANWVDIHSPLPDRAHEALRASLVAAIDTLTAEVQRIDDAFLMLLSTAHFAQATLNTVQGAQQTMAQLAAKVQAIDALQAQVTALTARVQALEADPLADSGGSSVD